MSSTKSSSKGTYGIGSRAVIHAIPAYILAYGGFRCLFGHNFALVATLTIITLVVIASYFVPKAHD